MKPLLPLFVLVILIHTGACSKTDRLCKLNLDVNCRICDQMEGRGKLLEYFNVDTNEFRLFILSSDGEVEIEHPNGRVSVFYDQVDWNKIQFIPGETSVLLINGDRFPVTPVSK